MPGSADDAAKATTLSAGSRGDACPGACCRALVPAARLLPGPASLPAASSASRRRDRVDRLGRRNAVRPELDARARTGARAGCADHAAPARDRKPALPRCRAGRREAGGACLGRGRGKVVVGTPEAARFTRWRSSARSRHEAAPRMSGIAGLLRFDGHRSGGTTSNAWPTRCAPRPRSIRRWRSPARHRPRPCADAHDAGGPDSIASRGAAPAAR